MAFFRLISRNFDHSLFGSLGRCNRYVWQIKLAQLAFGRTLNTGYLLTYLLTCVCVAGRTAHAETHRRRLQITGTKISFILLISHVGIGSSRHDFDGVLAKMSETSLIPIAD